MIAGFEDGKWPQAKECRQPPEAGKARYEFSPKTFRMEAALSTP